MITEANMKQSFLALQVAGVRPPDVYSDPDAKAMAIRMFLSAFDGYSRTELEQAVRAWAAGTNPFWPTPGQLRELVPGRPGSSPQAIRHRAAELFPLACRARSSCGRDPADAPRYLAHYGITDATEQAAVLAAVGNWATWDPGDPVHDPRGHSFAGKAFADGYEARLQDARDGRLALPAPPQLALPAPPDEPPRVVPRIPVLSPAPAPPPPPTPRTWSAAHVVAGLCAPADLGQPIPADWTHPLASRRGGGFRPAHYELPSPPEAH